MKRFLILSLMIASLNMVFAVQQTTGHTYPTQAMVDADSDTLHIMSLEELEQTYKSEPEYDRFLSNLLNSPTSIKIIEMLGLCQNKRYQDLCLK